MGRFLRSISIFAIIGILLIFFQNCGDLALFSNDDDPSNPSIETPLSSVNGVPYEGKIFASVELCPDDTPRARIKYYANKSSLLLREDCADLSPAQEIQASAIQILQSTPTILIYQERDFVEEVLLNKASFSQPSETWQTVTANAITSSAFTQNSIAGDLVVCAVIYQSPNSVAEINSMTDNAGNTYTRAVGPSGWARDNGTAGVTLELWYAENIVGGTGLQATANFSETMDSPQGINCYEYSGIVAANSLDQAGASYVQQGASGYTFDVDTMASNELIFIGVFSTDGTASSDLNWRGLQAPSVGDGAYDMMTTSAGIYSLDLPTTMGGSAVMATFRAQE